MSKNINQVYVASPITTNQNNDLMYFGRSPYGATDDKAMLYSNFVKPIQNNSFNFAVDSGPGDGVSYAVTLSPAVTSLTNGMVIYMLPSFDNTVNNPTLNVNGIGAKDIIFPNYNENLSPGDISSVNVSIFVYYAADDVFFLVNPANTYIFRYILRGYMFHGADDGVADAYVVTPDVGSFAGATAFSSGSLLTFTPDNTNTGASTLVIAGVDSNSAAKSIRTVSPDGSTQALLPGMIKANQDVTVIYSGSLGLWILLNPAIPNGNTGHVVLTPASGDTVTLSAANRTTLLNPAGALATLTVDMPASPINGQTQTVSTTQVVTALTVGGGTILSAPSALVAGQVFTMKYDTSSSKWYPA